MSGSILTDAFQGLVMLIAVFAVIIGFFMMTGGDLTPIANSPAFGPSFVDGVGSMPLQAALVFGLVFFVGAMGQPTMLAKMYSVKTVQDIKKAGIIGGVSYGVTSIVWILCGYGALYIVATGGAGPLQSADNAAFLFVSKLGGITQALVMAGLLAAIVSTASFFISMSSSAITRDLIGALGHEMAHEKQIRVGQVLQVLVPLIAIGMGIWGGRMVAILGALGWGFFASVTIPTFAIGMLWKRCSTEGILAGLWFAVIANPAYLLLENLKIFRFPFAGYLFCVAGAVILTVVVSLFTKTCAGENMPKALKPIFKL
jgi:Na+/proline symporter